DRRIGLADIQRADSLRSAQLVGGEREQVNGKLREIERELADGLRGVAMKQDASLAAVFADFANRIERTDLVVGEHDGDEPRGGLEGVCDLLRIDATVHICRDNCDLAAFTAKPTGGV